MNNSECGLPMPLGFFLLVACVAVFGAYCWFLYKATKRVIKEIRIIKSGKPRSANWVILTLAFLFVAGFIASLVNVLLGGVD